MSLPTATQLFRLLHLEPDPWQIQVLDGNDRRLLLNCCRQAGKSTVVAFLSLVEALYNPGTLVLLLSRSLRQSTELFRTVADFHRRLGGRFLEGQSRHELRFTHGSRIVSLPCQPDTVRGFSKVHMLVIDEAARVPDDLYRSVRPMLAVSRGRLICLSTPHGKRGFFYDAWAKGGEDWKRIEVLASQIPRITPEFLAEERRSLGSDTYYRQEYECAFEALEGLVYPDLPKCLVTIAGKGPHQSSPLSPPAEGRGAGGEGSPAGDSTPLAADTPPNSPLTTNHSPLIVPSIPAGKKLGGIDFGFRNPFAAVWGIWDRDGVLWLVGEHYVRQQPPSYHATKLPRDVTWYADPSGAAEISELNYNGLVVRKGYNDVRTGVAAVNARIADGLLKIVDGACPNLLYEASLYRYGADPEDKKSECPYAGPDHALDALRYLISRLDAGRRRRPRTTDPTTPDASPPAAKPRRPWLSIYNEALWRPLY
jgi:hypothetical protein